LSNAKGSSQRITRPSIAVNGKVGPPVRQPNASTRTREYLTPSEVDKILAVARDDGRYGHRDQTIMLLMFRHGLRVSELVALRRDQIELKTGLMAVSRVKAGIPSTHPIRGVELRALRQVYRDWPDSPYVIVSERGGPMTTSNVRKIVQRLGIAAKLPFPIHPHMFRHAC